MAAASVGLLSTSPAVSGAPVVVTDYKQLVGIVGSNNDYNTGERFSRYTRNQRTISRREALDAVESSMCRAYGCVIFGRRQGVLFRVCSKQLAQG